MMEAIRQIDLKVNARKTDKAVLRRLSHAFVEAKWSINDAISTGVHLYEELHGI